MVLISNLTDRHALHFLQIRLTGRKSNRDGLGARVRVTAGERTLTQFHDGKSGHLAQSSMPLYFGLGDASSVQRIELLWPSGKRQTVDRDIPMNRTLNITEPE